MARITDSADRFIYDTFTPWCRQSHQLRDIVVAVNSAIYATLFLVKLIIIGNGLTILAEEPPSFMNRVIARNTSSTVTFQNGRHGYIL